MPCHATQRNAMPCNAMQCKCNAMHPLRNVCLSVCLSLSCFSPSLALPPPPMREPHARKISIRNVHSSDGWCGLDGDPSLVRSARRASERAYVCISYVCTHVGICRGMCEYIHSTCAMYIHLSSPTNHTTLIQILLYVPRYQLVSNPPPISLPSLL